MNNYIETLLQRFEQYMQDIDAFYAIFSMIPLSYQYQAIMNLLEVEPLLEAGNRFTGIAQRGTILIDDYCLVVVDKKEERHVLCALPQPFDI